MPSASFLRFSESSGRDRGGSAPLKRPDQVIALIGIALFLGTVSGILL